MSEQSVETRFQYQDHAYVITAYHDGTRVTGYKMQREESTFSSAGPTFHFNILVSHHTPYLPEKDLWNIDEFPTLVAEYEARVEAPDISMRVEYKQPDMNVCLEVEMYSDSENESRSDSYMFAWGLAGLIESAAVGTWRNNPGDVQPEEFWGIVLMSVALNYNNSLPEPHTDKTAYDLIKIIAKQLRNTDNLNTILD